MGAYLSYTLSHRCFPVPGYRIDLAVNSIPGCIFLQCAHSNLIIRPGNHSTATGFELYALMLAVLLVLFPSVILADETLNAQMNLAKHGNAEAQFKVGEMYENGTGVRQDKREARYWFTRSANQGYELAGFKLLYMDLEAKGLKGENNARLEELNTKAKNGNSQAQLYLGKMYANGIGISKNPDAAIDWLSKSASAGVLEAELELAVVKVEKQRDQQNETRFETNPCSSKSAAFLSTCK